jgi:hypothetical protein
VVGGVGGFIILAGIVAGVVIWKKRWGCLQGKSLLFHFSSLAEAHAGIKPCIAQLQVVC